MPIPYMHVEKGNPNSDFETSEIIKDIQLIPL